MESRSQKSSKNQRDIWTSEKDTALDPAQKESGRRDLSIMSKFYEPDEHSISEILAFIDQQGTCPFRTQDVKSHLKLNLWKVRELLQKFVDARILRKPGENEWVALNYEIPALPVTAAPRPPPRLYNSPPNVETKVTATPRPPPRLYNSPPNVETKAVSGDKERRRSCRTSVCNTRELMQHSSSGKGKEECHHHHHHHDHHHHHFHCKNAQVGNNNIMEIYESADQDDEEEEEEPMDTKTRAG